MTRHRIESLDDILALSKDECARMLPDLLAWHDAMKDLQAAAPGAFEALGFEWVDDGDPGRISEVRIVKKTAPTRPLSGEVIGDG